MWTLVRNLSTRSRTSSSRIPRPELDWLRGSRLALAGEVAKLGLSHSERMVSSKMSFSISCRAWFKWNIDQSNISSLDPWKICGREGPSALRLGHVRRVVLMFVVAADVGPEEFASGVQYTSAKSCPGSKLAEVVLRNGTVVSGPPRMRGFCSHSTIPIK